MQRNKMLDLTQGSPLKQVILFGLPMLFGNVFQQLYNQMVNTSLQSLHHLTDSSELTRPLN